MNRRGNSNIMNQNNQRRSGKPNFVSGGQIFTKQPAQQAAPPQQATPIKQTIPKVEPTTTPRKPVVQPMEQDQIVQPVTQNIATQNKEEVKVETEKKSWMNRKIPKKEKIRRRNLRLSKMLQPKNALMILHELVQNPIFTVSEAGGQFQATVLVAGVQHIGQGKSKNAAKNAASEVAIKHLLKHKNVGAMDVSDDGDAKMDTFDANESSAEEVPLPWQQVASFALYKLFDSWGENPTVPPVEEPKVKKVNSAKKMPENPTSLNPIMLIHQMYPQATFDDLGQFGVPPATIVFKIQCNVDGELFEGSGPSKKVAKKMAAYAACHKLLGVVYPPEQYVPQV